MILAHFIVNDREVCHALSITANTLYLPLGQALQRTIHEWPKEIYDIAAVILAIQSELDRSSSTSSTSPMARPSGEATILMECLAELYAHALL
jgi:vacuolar protein sorting-associated protein 41